MRIATQLVPVALATSLLALSGTAVADRDVRDHRRPRPGAGQVATTPVAGGEFRASVSGGALAVEYVTGYQVAWRFPIEWVQLRGRSVRIGQLSQLRLGTWTGASLQFQAVDRRGGAIGCVLDTSNSWQTACQHLGGNGYPGGGNGYPGGGYGYPGGGNGYPGGGYAQHDLQAIEAANRTCSSYLSERGARDRCAQAVLASRVDQTENLRACAWNFDGDTNRVACLELAARTGQAEAEPIRTCSWNFDGDTNQLACLRETLPARISAETVRACSWNFDGDASQLACLNAVAGSRREPVASIQFCSRSESGDAAQLDCLRRLR
ncbi:MAG: hypothetical protein KBG28_23485 [Kofleriaceae bacterium]|nr:hypothetical protein [Kofleriaceae bacterium]